MSGHPTLTVTGHLTADPELRHTAIGAALTTFTVASTPRTYDRETVEWTRSAAQFIRCTAWRRTAEHLAVSLHRGDRVVVTGRLTQRTFQARDGANRTTFEIDVEDVGASLKHAVVTVRRDTVTATAPSDPSVWSDDAVTETG